MPVPKVSVLERVDCKDIQGDYIQLYRITMPEKQLGFLFSSRRETRGKGRNLFQQTNFFKWMWRDFSKQESQQMIKKLRFF